MLNIDILTFNLFEEKTYIVSQGNGYCVIVDPGCSNEAERQTLIKALTDKSLTTERLSYRRPIATFRSI